MAPRFQGIPLEPVMKTHRHLVAAVASLGIAGLVAANLWDGVETSSAPPQPASALSGAPARYIVQAANVETAERLVAGLGAQVTHRLGVIGAVGAELTAEQAGTLRATDGVRQLFGDAPLRTSSVCSVSGGLRQLKDKKFTWMLTNTSSSVARIGAVTARWPSVNTTLKKIKLNGADVWTAGANPPYVNLVSGWHDDAQRRDIGPGRTVELLLEFDSDIDYNQANYEVFVDFVQGCSVAFEPQQTDCRASGMGDRNFGGKQVKWRIPNTGTDWITIGDVGVNWPETAGLLKKVKLNGLEIFRTERLAPVTTVAQADWLQDLRDRRIEPGKDVELLFEFQNDVSKDQQDYSLIVDMMENCSVEFAPDATVPGDDKADKKARTTYYPMLVGAEKVHAEGIKGDGVTVAIIDTGIWSSGGGKSWIRKDRDDGSERVKRAYDAIDDVDGDAPKAEDDNGHGSHVASVIASMRMANSGNGGVVSNGVAPDADLVVVRAFDRDGQGTYLDVIRGIDWVVRNKDVYGIRVLNLSMSAPPRSHYRDDPLNQAVMAAWKAGIVVVASAGNSGPEAMTIGVPGNVPYVVTVGAMTNNYTPANPADDYLATFSSTGPTHEGFVKPELVAPGGRVLGLMNKKSRIPKDHPNFHDGDSYYYMSGTSQAAAIVSGVAALILDAQPGLTPDEVKCRLMAGARPATRPDGKLAYSIFQQGAGLIDAWASVHSTGSGCANQGLSIDADLAGTMHFGGRANQASDGSFYLMEMEGYRWDGSYSRADGYLWSNGYLWNNGYLWTNGQVGTNGYLWTNGLEESMGINGWVPQEQGQKGGTGGHHASAAHPRLCRRKPQARILGHDDSSNHPECSRLPRARADARDGSRGAGRGPGRGPVRHRPQLPGAGGERGAGR